MFHHEPSSRAMLPTLIDHRARNDGDRPFAVFPSRDGEAPSQITFAEFQQACTRFGRTVCPEAPVKDGYVVGIVGTTDTLTYLAAIGGIISAGLTPYPISTRIPASAVCHLLKNVSARRLLVTSAFLSPLVADIRETLSAMEFSVDIEEMPAITDIYPIITGGTAPIHCQPLEIPEQSVYPNGVEIYLHSSGSTGVPKSLPFSAEFIRKIQYQGVFTTYPKENISFSGNMPSFHSMGFWFQLMHPLMTGLPVALFSHQHPAPPVLPTPATVIDAIRKTKATTVYSVPAFLESWSHDEEAIKTLRNMTLIVWSGGPLAQEAGNKLFKLGCPIQHCYGLTEAGCIPRFFGRHRGEEWPWMEIAENVTMRWVPNGEGLYEMQLLASDTQGLAVENLSDVRGYATQDLWERHPDNEYLWKPVGRLDDLFKMANGETIVPVPIEGALLAHPLVKGAMVFGRGRDQIGMFIEPVQDDVDPHQFLNDIWSAAETVNKVVPAYSRIFKEMIIVIKPDRPLPRAAKGTVNRKAALAEFSKEIDDLYTLNESVERAIEAENPPSWKEQSAVATWTLNVASSVLGRQVNSHSDLFVQGYDSLTATMLRRRIAFALRAVKDAAGVAVSDFIGQDFVYANPTIDRISRTIAGLVASRKLPQTSQEDVVIDLVDTYTQGMPKLTGSAKALPAHATVLLTGSTGYLGSHLLVRLLQDERVKQVYAYNRPSKSGGTLGSRHEAAFQDRGLDLGLLASSKLILLEGDASESNLGLSSAEYSKLVNTVDVIIHTAWQLDFNLDVNAFEKQIAATRKLVDLAMTSPRSAHARVVFTSSISVARNWPAQQGLFPEEALETPVYSAGTGYGEAKFVAESILKKARANGLQTTSVRLGQISGNNFTGAWALSDWVPIMLKSSVVLGCLPITSGLLTWSPPEDNAEFIVEAALRTEVDSTLNFAHLNPVPWAQIGNDFADALVKQDVTPARLQLVQFEEWYALLKARDEKADASDIQSIPALKLLSFFAQALKGQKTAQTSGVDNHEAFGLPRMQTLKARNVRSDMKAQVPLQSADVARWVRYWKEKGLF